MSNKLIGLEKLADESLSVVRRFSLFSIYHAEGISLGTSAIFILAWNHEPKSAVP